MSHRILARCDRAARTGCPIEAMPAAEFAGCGEQQVRTAVGPRPLARYRHPLAVEVEAFGDREPQPLDPARRIKDLTGDQRRSELIGVGDPVVPGERILREHLREIEVGRRAVEDREPALVPIRRPDIEQSRLQRLGRVARPTSGCCAPSRCPNRASRSAARATANRSVRWVGLRADRCSHAATPSASRTSSRPAADRRPTD